MIQQGKSPFSENPAVLTEEGSASQQTMSIREKKFETNESTCNIDIGTVLIRDGSGECAVFGYGHTEYFKDYIDAAQAANSAKKDKTIKKNESIIHAEGSAKGGKPAIAVS